MILHTITLEQELSFTESLQAMLSGKCLGIRPGNNTNFVEMYKTGWMNQEGPDYMLRWHRTEADCDIRTNQYLGKWYAVVINHLTSGA